MKQTLRNQVTQLIQHCQHHVDREDFEDREALVVLCNHTVDSGMPFVGQEVLHGVVAGSEHDITELLYKSLSDKPILRKCIRKALATYDVSGPAKDCGPNPKTKSDREPREDESLMDYVARMEKETGRKIPPHIRGFAEMLDKLRH